MDTVGGARGIERLHTHLHQDALSSEDIVTGWQEGNARAVRTVDIWLDLVSGPLAMVVNVIGPSVMPVGGGLSNSAALVTAMDAAVRARSLRAPVRPLLVQAHHRDEPGLIGASLLGYQGLPDE